MRCTFIAKNFEIYLRIFKNYFFVNKTTNSVYSNHSSNILLFTNSIPSCTCVIPCSISVYVYNTVNIALM